MTNTNVNMVELQQAIKQFGSLKAAIEVLEGKKQALETEISGLTNNIELMKKKETQVIHNITRTEQIYEQRELELHTLQGCGTTSTWGLSCITNGATARKFMRGSSMFTNCSQY